MKDQSFDLTGTIFSSADLRRLPRPSTQSAETIDVAQSDVQTGGSEVIGVASEPLMHYVSRLAGPVIDGGAGHDAILLQNSELKHDLNNLIQVSLSALSLIAIRIQQGRSAELSTLIQRAESSLERGSAVARRMAALPFGSERDVRLLDVNLAVQDMYGIFSSVAGSNVEVRICLSPIRTFVQCDRISFETALLNLMTNARNAISDLGVIEIRTSIEVRRSMTTSAPRQHVMIRVSDSGHGMTQEVASRVFEAFYSTRHGSGGSGLGLAAVRRFLDENDGQSEIESIVGSGTSVSLFLPICTDIVA